MLKHFISLKNLGTATIQPHYNNQPTVSPTYKPILLEARNLQRSLDQYYYSSSSLQYTICTSCHHGELPIVINTGASMSITPTLHHLRPPNQLLHSTVSIQQNTQWLTKEKLVG